MKNQKKLKETIKQIKRELSNAQIFVSQIKLIPQDSKSAKIRDSAIMTIAKIEKMIATDLSGLEKEISIEEAESRSESYRKALGTINSPSLAMKKTADSFIESSKQPNLLMKKAMQEQIRKASLQNVQKTVSGS